MPSRICVKNLPKYVAEDRLRELFSQKGEITDAKLMRTKEGKSRQFAFIGFRTQQEAEEAIKYFNKSFIDTSRITCEVARKVGDPEIPRPWSRYSQKKEDNITANVNKDVGAQGSSIKVTKGGAKNNKKGIEEEDPQLQEFLQIMQPRTKAKLWANDALIAPGVDQNVKAGKEDTQAKKGGGKKLVPVDLKLNDNDSNAAENVQLNESDSHVPDQSHNLACDEVVSDMDYFNSRVKKEWSDSESESREEEEEDDNDDDDDDDDGDDGDEKQDSDSANDSEKTDQSAQNDIRGKDVAQMEVEDRHTSRGSNEEIDEPARPPSMSEDGKDEVLDTSRLFVRNLPYTATEDDLEEHFSRFGGVTRVHLLVDKDTKRSKGIAYIQYTLPDSAARALEELDKSIFQGRLLHVMPAKQKAPSDKQETDVHTNQATKTFKQRREEERKASEASGNTKAWNSLFMRPDTIVENIARRHGVSKGDLLDREADDLAVRIALGETQVIAETKMALANSGVNVTSLEEYAMGKTDGMKRSNHVLLVKNLPYGSSEGELAKMFSKFGSLDKVILPPTKTLGLVVFLEPSEARAAFKGMAYKRYKDAPLYLEWAPANVLTASKGNDKTNAVVGEHDAKREILEQSVEGILEDMDPDRIEARSLFVKNLNFKTSEDSLRKYFSEQIKKGSILSVRIKKHLKNGKNVSMGYGFIELDSMETATNVCRDLQGTVLDGYALILQLCHAKEGQVEKKVEKDKSSTKLLVRNVAFEATEKDLRQLFSPFGQVKSLRLPRKFGNHRGFAFVEFVTKQEAQNALGALANTHLYGRHLVLERAKEGESLEELRSRTAAQFADDQNAIYNPTKLSKKRKDVAVLDEGKVKFQRITE